MMRNRLQGTGCVALQALMVLSAHTGALVRYRDVAVNLRFSTYETRGLGIDTHLCEVQLILNSFASLKHDYGHKQYVEFRDARGE